MVRIGIDVGGTFTDFTVLNQETGALGFFKVPSTPADPSAAIETGLRQILADGAVRPEHIGFLGHGTTLATNMIIERRGAPTAFLTTKGFRDVLEIGRQTRPHLYDYNRVKPPPLVPRALRFEVRGRLDVEGQELHALAEDDVRTACAALRGQDIAAVAIGFVHAYADPAHEQRAASLVRQALPHAFVTLSSEVLPEFREYERFSTTVMNATLGPPMAAYLDRLLTRVQDLAIRAPLYTIHSNGGLMSVGTVRRHPVRTCLSGPSAGVTGAAQIARRLGYPDAVTFDVGGTSTDVSVITDGTPAFTAARTVADYPVKTPMVDIHVIGAGGGSIAWIDAAGALKVGPHSAGASPGPVVYGRGGTAPTLTDANVVLGRLNPVALLKGALPLDATAGRAAIAGDIAGPTGLSPEVAAHGMVRVAVANMGRAIRSVSTERGHDLRGFALVAFGGAGPLHAAQVARECGIPTILVPRAPGTLCARGALMSDISLDFVATGLTDATTETWRATQARFAAMRREAEDWLAGEAVPVDQRGAQTMVDLRFHGQNHELSVPVAEPDKVDLSAVLEAFHALHRQVYGYTLPDRGVEIVTCRLKAIGRVPRPSEPPVGAETPVHAARTGERPVWFDDAEGWTDTPVFDRERLPAGADLSGPAVLEEMSATTLVLPGQRLQVEPTGTLIITETGLGR